MNAVQGLSKRGMDLTYLGNGSSVLAVAGQCSQGGNIVIWDSHRPLTSGPVARLSYHMAAVTALKVPTSPFKNFMDCALGCVWTRRLICETCAAWCTYSNLPLSSCVATHQLLISGGMPEE